MKIQKLEMDEFRLKMALEVITSGLYIITV